MKLVAGFLALVVTACSGLVLASPASAQPLEDAIQACLSFASKDVAGNTVADAESILEKAISDGCKAPDVDPAAGELGAGRLLNDTADAIDQEFDTHCRSGLQGRCAALATVRGRAFTLNDLRSGNVVTIPESQRAVYFELNGDESGYGGSAPLDMEALIFAAAARQGVGPDAVCESCVTLAKDLVRVVVYAKALYQVYLKGPAHKAWGVVAEKAAERKANWEAYHFGGGEKRAQLFWELGVNDFFYRQSREFENNTPPTSYLTVMHPSAGLALKDRNGADTNILGVVEIVGWNTFGLEGGKRSNEWGGSLIAAYQPSDSGDDWGYGVLVRTPWNNINIAWVRTELDAGGADETFLISLDLTNLLPDSWKDVVGDALGFSKRDGE